MTERMRTKEHARPRFLRRIENVSFSMFDFRKSLNILSCYLLPSQYQNNSTSMVWPREKLLRELLPSQGRFAKVSPKRLVWNALLR